MAKLNFQEMAITERREDTKTPHKVIDMCRFALWRGNKRLPIWK